MVPTETKVPVGPLMPPYWSTKLSYSWSRPQVEQARLFVMSSRMKVLPLQLLQMGMFGSVIEGYVTRLATHYCCVWLVRKLGT